MVRNTVVFFVYLPPFRIRTVCDTFQVLAACAQNGRLFRGNIEEVPNSPCSVPVPSTDSDPRVPPLPPRYSPRL